MFLSSHLNESNLFSFIVKNEINALLLFQPDHLNINTIFLSQPWSSVSTLAKSFIDRLLTYDPEERMTAEEALKHPWLVSMAACSSNKNLHRSISRNLQRRASHASSRCPSSGSTPGSHLGVKPGSPPGSAPRLGLGPKSQSSLKVTSWCFDVLDSLLWCMSPNLADVWSKGLKMLFTWNKNRVYRFQ